MNIFSPNLQQRCKSAIYTPAENSALRGPQANYTPLAGRRTTPPTHGPPTAGAPKGGSPPPPKGGVIFPKKVRTKGSSDRKKRLRWRQKQQKAGRRVLRRGAVRPSFFRKKRRKILQGDRTARRFGPPKEAGSLQRAKQRDGFGLDTAQKRRRRPLYI